MCGLGWVFVSTPRLPSTLPAAGHPEAHIHSGESAVIAPRLVSSLGKRQVLAVAAAKHHTLFCTTAGEAYTMGSNRFGQLGYAVDTQPTPRRSVGYWQGCHQCGGRGSCGGLVGRPHAAQGRHRWHHYRRCHRIVV